MIRLNALRLWLACLAMCLGAGCEPTAQFRACQGRRIVQAGELKAVAFVSTFEVTRMARKQIIYNVRLFGRTGRPVRSSDGRYQNRAGEVAATRTFVAHLTPQLFENISVTLPAGELEFSQAEIPVTAEVSILTVDREMLATRTCRVPVASVEEFRPPLERSEPDTTPYWFIRATTKGAPVMVGPFDSSEAAAAAFPDAPAPPVVRMASDGLWFVPMQRAEPPPGELLMGPCATEADAAALVRMLDAAVKQRRLKLRAGAPERLRITGWLQRPNVEPDDPQRRARRALRLLGLELPKAAPTPATQPASSARSN